MGAGDDETLLTTSIYSGAADVSGNIIIYLFPQLSNLTWQLVLIVICILWTQLPVGYWADIVVDKNVPASQPG